MNFIAGYTRLALCTGVACGEETGIKRIQNEKRDFIILFEGRTDTAH